MTRDDKIINQCPKCELGPVTCRYNHFEKDALTIDSWEHRCANCGYRETNAFRSDDPEAIPAGTDPAVCPYCGRSGRPEV